MQIKNEYVHFHFESSEKIETSSFWGHESNISGHISLQNTRVLMALYSCFDTWTH